MGVSTSALSDPHTSRASKGACFDTPAASARFVTLFGAAP
jgi:hypothetical protein